MDADIRNTKGDALSSITGWLLPMLEMKTSSPFLLALSGVQGSGKSTLVKAIEQSLTRAGYRTAQLSLDDLYQTNAIQLDLAKTGNTLWGSRGQFGTHDVALAKQVLAALKQRNEASVLVPTYDKSMHRGCGDRAPESDWPRYSTPLDVIILEGWGVGFQSLSEDALREAWQEAKDGLVGEVARHTLIELEQVNMALKQYNDVFMGPQHFDALILLQPLATQFVYDWRLQQEHAMRKAKGTGMSDEEVHAFVQRYYTSYELYLSNVILGFFNDDQHKTGHQINLVLDTQRELVQVNII